MNWTLIWLDGPLDQLARHYIPLWGTPASQAVTDAMARVDRLLERNPLDAGESRAGHRRLLVESPLTVEFEVFDEQRTVVVTAARYTPPRAG
ncbi:MAG: hypothetical protein K2X87_10010 [Gemmataceae bacterium]|nr:hypothetical protein [Gemmataceae bacterium]